MSLLINILLLLFGVAGTLAAFGGETWRKTEQPLIQRITKRGWLALSCISLSLTFGIIKEFRNNRLAKTEFQKRQALEEQLRVANSRIMEVPRLRHSQLVHVAANGQRQYGSVLFGGDEFKYIGVCAETYLKVGSTLYHLNPRTNAIIITGVRGEPMKAVIINKSARNCTLKTNVYSIR